MGAKVIVAEIDTAKGKRAQKNINDEFPGEHVDFYKVDLADEIQINGLFEYITDKYGHLDVIIHNAAVVPMGAVDAVKISDWDLSYAVNLRAPVLLTQKFLPSMRENGGVIIFNPSAPGAFMSAYEIFKTAQVELCNTLSQELAGTPVITYSVTPGFVKTDTCIRAVKVVASSMGIAVEDFYEGIGDILTDTQIAGAGYAVSVMNAERYNGKATSSYQVMASAGLLGVSAAETESHNGTPWKDCELPKADYDNLLALFTSVADTFYHQYQSWMKNNLFQKQFVLNHFKKEMGQSADEVKKQLEDLYGQIKRNHWEVFLKSKKLFEKLLHFYGLQREMLQGWEKDPERLKSDTALLDSWIETLQNTIGQM
jgi:NAD(P)-dependent dehydrogenase (short-subunit alcohol dehydrogenase family)